MQPQTEPLLLDYYLYVDKKRQPQPTPIRRYNLLGKCSGVVHTVSWCVTRCVILHDLYVRGRPAADGKDCAAKDKNPLAFPLFDDNARSALNPAQEETPSIPPLAADTTPFLGKQPDHPDPTTPLRLLNPPRLIGWCLTQFIMRHHMHESQHQRPPANLPPTTKRQLRPPSSLFPQQQKRMVAWCTVKLRCRSVRSNILDTHPHTLPSHGHKATLVY